MAAPCTVQAVILRSRLQLRQWWCALLSVCCAERGFAMSICLSRNPAKYNMQWKTPLCIFSWSRNGQESHQKGLEDREREREVKDEGSCCSNSNVRPVCNTLQHLYVSLLKETHWRVSWWTFLMVSSAKKINSVYWYQKEPSEGLCVPLTVFLSSRVKMN